MLEMTFFVPGLPIGQPKHPSRAVKLASGKYVAQAHAVPQKHPVHDWRAWIKRAAIDRSITPYSGPVRVDLMFIFPRPKYMLAKKYQTGRIYHVHKFDRDNLDKAVLDALKGIAYLDDCQVCDGWIKKRYCALNGDYPGVYITLSFLDDDSLTPIKGN